MVPEVQFPCFVIFTYYAVRFHQSFGLNIVPTVSPCFELRSPFIVVLLVVDEPLASCSDPGRNFVQTFSTMNKGA